MLQLFDEGGASADDVSRREWLRLGTASAAGMSSFFGRRALPQKKYARNHQPRARWLTDRIWAAELRRLKNGRAIPFGSSCLLVVEKR